MTENKLSTGLGVVAAGFERSRDTARAATEQAVKKLGVAPSALLVFGSPLYDGPSVLAGISDVAGDAPLAGASCAAQVADGLLEDNLIVLALHSPLMDVVVGAAPNLFVDPATAVETTIAQISPRAAKTVTCSRSTQLVPDWQGGFVLAIFPALLPDPLALHALHRATAALRKGLPQISALFGFGATNSSKGKGWQLANGECLCQGLVLVHFRTGLEFGIGFAHGLVNEDAASQGFTVTNASDGAASEIDGAPLTSVLSTRLLGDSQTNLKHIFLCRPSGSSAAILPVQLVAGGDTNRELLCELPLDKGAELSVPLVNGRRLIEAAGRAAIRSLGEPTVRSPKLAFVVGSRWRLEALENKAAEVDAARRQLSGVRLVGVYTDSFQVILGRGYEACCDGLFGALTVGPKTSYLYEAHTRNTRLLRAAHEMLRAMGPEAVFQRIVDAAYSLLECRSCTLRLLDERNRLVLKAVRGVTEKHHRENYPTMELGRSIVGRAVAEERTIVESDLRTSKFYETPELAERYGLGSLFCQPFWVAGKAVGALTVYYADSNGITSDRRDMAVALCEMVAAAVEQPKELNDVIMLCEKLGQLADQEEAAQEIARATRGLMKCQAVEVYCQDVSIRSFLRDACDGDDVSPEGSPSGSSSRERAQKERQLAIVVEPPSSLFGAKLAASVPVMVGQEVIALITALWKDPEDIWPGAWQMLETLATRIAFQLHNIMLTMEQQHIAKLMAGVGPIPKKRMTAKDTISGILKTVRKEFDVGSVVLYLWRHEESAYVATEAYGFKRKQPMLQGKWSKFRLEDGLVGTAATENNRIYVKLDEEKVASEAYFRHLQSNMKAGTLRLCIVFPLGLHQTPSGRTLPVGIMVFADDRVDLFNEQQPFQPLWGAALSGLGQHVKLYLDWLRLEEARSSFALSSAHQVLAPLAAVGGYVEAIAQSGPSPQLLRSARASIAQANHIAQVQVHANRIAGGLIPYGVQAVDLCDLVNNVAAIYRPLAERRNVRLTVTSPAQSLLASTSLVMARAILDNLFSNAVEYSTEGGSVSIALARADRGARLVIEDSGSGIPSNLAEAFEEGKLSVLAPHGSQGGGLGMGLAIVQNYARQLDWDCVLTTVPHRGTRFEFSIPKRPGRHRRRRETHVK